MNESHELFDTGFQGPREVKPASLNFLSPATGPDELGRLAHYRVLKTLGEGGMGIVLLAEDTQLQRPVALKVIRPEIGRSPADRQRFLREARAMAQVKSDHVVTVYQVGQIGDVCYLAMELLEGETLDCWLNKTRTPPVDEVLRIGREIAMALSAAHARGLVHRDVKPANIWLEAPSRRVKLLDFGLARPQTEGPSLTDPGMVVGTPMYMAPEQARGETLDGRTDLFSLGCLLYQMLTGRPPFDGKTPVAVLTSVITDTPSPPDRFNPALPIPLSKLLFRLLAKQRTGRPDSAELVSAELLTIERALPHPTTDLLPQATVVTPAGQALSPSNLHWSGVQPQTIPPSAKTLVSSSRSLGTPSSQRRAREAERRQVTVLVCGTDLFESDSYLGLDAEDQVKVLRSFGHTCDQAVRRFEGTVVQCDERGLLVCFGYPVAFEDAARCAARTALGLIEDLNALPGQFRHAFELNPWVGLHTGLAVVEAKDDVITLVGEARNVAVRLEDVRAPGQVVCTEATHRLIHRHFDCVGLGSQKIKGVAQPVPLFRVEAAAATGNLIEASTPAGLSPLTGRDLEVNLLKDRWEQAVDGMGQIILLVGEPGLGKSRLVHTLKQHVMGQAVEGEVDAPVIEWRCAPHFQNTGLYPAIDFYERGLAFGREESPGDRFDRLLRRLEQYDLARPETVPLWAALLSLPTPERFPPISLPPARQREETFRVMLEWLRTRASRKPVLFVIEDLHWADASTIEFLGLFFDEGLNDRVLTLLTFRPEFQPPWPAAARQTTLSLNRLTKRQAADLMNQKTGATVPAALIEQIYDRTGGVPLFVEEFTRMVQESGALNRTGDGTASEILPAREIPATLQDLVTARLDRMEGEREVAQLGAVLGREFSLELISAATTLDEATLQAELAALVRAEILFSKGRPPRCTYTFKHALLEDSLYNSLVKDKRQQFHRRIGEAMESRFPQTVETRPELLAHHFTEAGLPEKAITYWLKAGVRSRERSADNEAIGHLRKGLSLLETLAESRARDERELQFLTTLAPAYIAARGYAAPEVGTILLRARELCERSGDKQQLFGIMLGLWEWHIVRADLRLCVGLATDGMALAESANDPGMRMEALFMPGVTNYYRGHFADARKCFDKALDNYEDSELTRFWTNYTGHNASVTHRCYLALALWHLGYPDQAVRTIHEARELAQLIGHTFTLGHAIDFAAVLFQDCRLGADLQAVGVEELTLGADQGFPLWHALGNLHKGAGLYLQGRRDEALPLLLKGFSTFRATGAEVRVPRYLGMFVHVYTQLGQFADAHKALEEGLAVAEKNDDRTHEAELHRLKGELLLAEAPGQITDAEACFRCAIETARRQCSRGWELRATMSLARLWQQRGRRDEARAALAVIYNTYTEGFTTPDLVDAKALLESLA